MEKTEIFWKPFEQGVTIGQQGSERGRILSDEEHVDGARITLEEDGYHPFGITCGVYGLMVHTAFASDKNEATSKYEAMKKDIHDFLTDSSLSEMSEEECNKAASDWCRKFVDTYY